VETIRADRRWCLTGTPIQNKLDDLGALIQFLRVEPFDGESSKAAFRNLIVDPLFSNDADPCRNLRRLLQSICLRRTTQDQSNLTATDELVTLSLSPMERSTYDKFLEQTHKELDMLVSKSSSLQKYTKLFTLILRLRMLCDQGHFCKGISSLLCPLDMPQTWYPTELKLSDDLGCDLCQNEESIDLMKDLAFCPSCSQILTYLNPEGPGSISESVPPLKPYPPQSSYHSNEPAGVIRLLARSQQSFLAAEVSAEEYPTKLVAVAKRLQDNIPRSKRSVLNIDHSYFLAGLTHLQHRILMLDENVGYPHSTTKRAADSIYSN
jgi:SNF2-related domain